MMEEMCKDDIDNLKELKVLIVEDGQYYMYGNALMDAFIKNGFEKAKLFALSEYITGSNHLFNRIQNKLVVGPMIRHMNRRLIELCRFEKPDLIFFYRCRNIFPSTVKILKSNGAVIFSYNNDNPFSAYFPGYYWRYYRKSLQYDDVTFVYRKSNLNECLRMGAKQVELLRSYYIRSKNFPVAGIEKCHAKYDVVFLGHHENDNRMAYLKALTSAGISVGIPKENWVGIDEDNRDLIRLEDTRSGYNLILNESKIALVFLSTLNKDTYTRRCFEIPATKTFMLSQYTDDLAGMFEPDKEAVYFRTPDELVEKTRYYLEHEEEREQIAQAGYDRLIRDGHEIGDRVRQIVDKYYEITKNEQIEQRDEC